MAQTHPSQPLTRIARVRLPGAPSDTLWDVIIEDGKIASTQPHPHDFHRDNCNTPNDPGFLHGESRLLAPSLCHAHIHLDKCFLMQWTDLKIHTGSFIEAMDLTAREKSAFDQKSLMARGSRLIEESIGRGVTEMRAFVEVDHQVEFSCLHVALELKDMFRDRCMVQICAFAQLPLFCPENGERNRELLNQAAGVNGVDVIGSTPYVEEGDVNARENIEWTIRVASKFQLHVDFHLDYNVDKRAQLHLPLVLDALRTQHWSKSSSRTGQHVTLGHCTRLSLFSGHEWSELARRLQEDRLDISFVGLPTSDLYMMRSKDEIRGTLPVVDMIRNHGLHASIAVNNVGNPFTPHGNCDPLSLASLGVGLYHAGNEEGTHLLYASPCMSKFSSPF